MTQGHPGLRDSTPDERHLRREWWVGVENTGAGGQQFQVMILMAWPVQRESFMLGGCNSGFYRQKWTVAGAALAAVEPLHGSASTPQALATTLSKVLFTSSSTEIRNNYGLSIVSG